MNKAYLEGFCKTAEKYGVDPAHLIKVAQPLSNSPDDYKLLGRLAAGTGGAILGGGIGTLTGIGAATSDENKGKRTKAFIKHLILGALAGGTAGTIGFGDKLGLKMLEQDYPLQSKMYEIFGGLK